MRQFLFTCLASAALLLATGMASAQSYSATSYKLTIEGSSTMHEWSSSATNVNVQSDFSVTDGVIEKINAATVTVVTKSIKSHKNSGLMDSRTHETLKADKFPNITYVFTKITNVQKNGTEATITVSGNLTIAGVAKPTELVLKSKVLPNGDIEIKGNRKVLMSDHGIKAPVFMLGALKVGDEVKIDFNVVLHKK
ncbi:MAG TPA: YceI family protein [Lacibacter sp.]|nr:YceI family protein [Lacibacter sp.]HMO88820.1 YceI family protein [Lacibacter sp.]